MGSQIPVYTTTAILSEKWMWKWSSGYRLKHHYRRTNQYSWIKVTTSGFLNLWADSCAYQSANKDVHMHTAVHILLCTHWCAHAMLAVHTDLQKYLIYATYSNHTATHTHTHTHTREHTNLPKVHLSMQPCITIPFRLQNYNCLSYKSAIEIELWCVSI